MPALRVFQVRKGACIANSSIGVLSVGNQLLPLNLRIDELLKDRMYMASGIDLRLIDDSKPNGEQMIKAEPAGDNVLKKHGASGVASKGKGTAEQFETYEPGNEHGLFNLLTHGNKLCKIDQPKQVIKFPILNVA